MTTTCGRRGATMASSCNVDVSRIHEIGKIQGCGRLIVVEEVKASSTYPSGIRIVGASANVATASWFEGKSTMIEFLGKDIGQLWRGECVETARSLLARHKDKFVTAAVDHVFPVKANRNLAHICPSLPRIYTELVLLEDVLPSEFTRDGKGEVEILTCTVAGSNPGLYLLELETKHSPQCASVKRSQGLLHVADVLGRVPVGSNPQVTSGALCDSLMEIMPTFDRIMVYRFAADHSGEVIHEAVRPGSGLTSSYLGLRYPATDIPPAARALFKLNGVRFIADTSAPGVPIELLHERVTTLDLSASALRASSECHLDYLRNMGVKSSLVVAIVVDGGLWGLYSFHSYTRIVNPTCEERIAVETAAAVTSSLISLYGRNERTTKSLAMSRTLSTLNNYTRLHDFLAAEYEALVNILDVDSVVLCESSRPVAVYGNSEVSLTPEECTELLEEVGSDGSVVFKALETRGIAFFSVRSFLIVFIRGSIARHVHWAGVPDTPLVDQEKLHPQVSFEEFLKMARGKFEPWSPATADLLSTAHHGISSHLYAEASSACLEEFFSHMSHELRTPFHAVMGSLDILQENHARMDVAEREDIIDSAVQCGASMMSTLDSLIGVTKHRGNTALARRRFVASRPINETMQKMKQFAASKMVELDIRISVGPTTSPPAAATSISNDNNGGIARPHEVIGDEGRIMHIVQNLVTNAISFTPGGGKVQASLFVFESRQDATDWWAKEAARFDDNMWMGHLPTIDGVQDLVGEVPGSESSASFSLAVKRWYMYCVEDTGVGIRNGDLPYVLQAYRQVSHGFSKSHQGTGLGLYICKLHVGAMSGCLGIASTLSGEYNELGGGSLFAVAIPLLCPAGDTDKAEPTISREKRRVGEMDAEAEVKVPETTVPAVTGDSSVSGGGEGGDENGDTDVGSNKKVLFLVVDDQHVNVKLMAKKIATIFQHCRAEVQVLFATDGEKALDVLSEVRKDLATHGDDAEESVFLAGVFMDIHMPIMDGIECTRSIRRLESEKGWSPANICGVTADITEATRLLFLDAGGDDIIYKPWTPGRLEPVCNSMATKALIKTQIARALGGAAEGGV